jgi:hypothetical protein
MNSISTKVTGSGSSSINEIVSFNNTLGTLLRQGAAQVTDSRTAPITADGAAVTGFSQGGITSQAIFNQSVMSGNATTFNDYDSLRGVSLAPALSTVNQVNGISGYTINNTVPIGQRTQTVAVFGDAVCAVNNSNCWGVDTIVSDNPTQTNTGVTAGTGKFLYNEFDLNITSPSTQGANLQVGGTALPTSVTLAVNAISINKLWGAGGSGTGTALYGNGFIAADACCAFGLSMGKSAVSGANHASMTIALNYSDSGAVTQNITLSSFGSALYIGGTAGFAYATPNFPNPFGGGTAFMAGANGSSGTNTPSQYFIWNYFDGSSALQNYSARVDNLGRLAFSSTATSPQYFFVGALATSGNLAAPAYFAGVTPGVTCSGTPTSGFQSSGGIVTHC